MILKNFKNFSVEVIVEIIQDSKALRKSQPDQNLYPSTDLSLLYWSLIMCPKCPVDNLS